MKMKRGLFSSTICFLYLSRPYLVSSQEESPEVLFRQAVASWHSSEKLNYEPFDRLSHQLEDKFFQHSSSSSPNNKELQLRLRLEIIGVMEESILQIETFIFQEQQGRENRIRDATLSQLYTTYAKALHELSPEECKALALDPHTLLIGADTVSNISEPSSDLCLENADNSIRNAATLDANNQDAEDFLQKIHAGSAVHVRKPKEFVAELFDSFADSFDEKLLVDLEYQVPELVGQLVRQLLVSSSSKWNKYPNALDAGCGTGLAGRHLRSLVEYLLIGVDASQKMLDIAKVCTRSKGCGLSVEEEKEGEEEDRPLYDNVIAMDLEDMTVSNTLLTASTSTSEQTSSGSIGFDLIVAADVLVYFGSLDQILQTFANVSTPASILVFSCEKATTEEAPLGYRLLPSGRFAHTKEHAIEMAEKVGYALSYYQDIVPRMEKGEPVKGHLFGFEFKSKEAGEEGQEQECNERK